MLRKIWHAVCVVIILGIYAFLIVTFILWCKWTWTSDEFSFIQRFIGTIFLLGFYAFAAVWCTGILGLMLDDDDTVGTIERSSTSSSSSGKIYITFDPNNSNEIQRIEFRNTLYAKDPGTQLNKIETAQAASVDTEANKFSTGDAACKATNTIELDREETSTYGNFTVEPRGGGPRAV